MARVDWTGQELIEKIEEHGNLKRQAFKVTIKTSFFSTQMINMKYIVVVL